MKNLIACILASSALLISADASAFCGFYVGGAGTELFNDASQVVLMRDGTKTILSMQNRYEGPVENFALVIPVPEVLMEANVKTLDASLFAKLDQLTAPRLVEYFEDDPCYEEPQNDFYASAGNNGTNGSTNNGVVVEAEFKVGEYEIVVLSAEDSSGLETWLTANDYNIPTGAAPYYQPYIDGGMYFFVARVDPAKVTFDGDRAILSPLRFDFDSDNFSLPVRLGMINSAGEQDIIIHTLGREQRYELANYDNVTIPTNLELTPDAKDSFGQFYKTLYARTVEASPGAIVTEYSWQASSCDPCPGPVLDSSDLLTLGADVIGNEAEYDFGWVITRLHARYAKDEIGEDLVFKKAEPIVGGREFVVDENGKLEEGATPSDINNFQGRYIIRHPWDGAIDCDEPTFDRWGSRTAGSAQGPTSTGGAIEFDANYTLPGKLVDDVPELGIDGTGQRASGTSPAGGGSGKTDPSCGGCASASPAGPISGLLLLLGFGVIQRRRK